MNESTSTNSHSNARPYIVGVGASAGGLEALGQFFDNLPANMGMVFVVVQHLSPDFKSMMVPLLAKHTAMDVHRVDEEVLPEPNNVYLIPPKRNIVIRNGRLGLIEPQDTAHGINLPIDIFLRSLAEECKEHSVGVILSGTGSDGVRGIRAIKEVGGLVMAQQAETAKFDGMPRSAIATGLVDFVLPADKMGEQLRRYINHPRGSSEPLQSLLLDGSDTTQRIFDLVAKQTGLDLHRYKPSTVARRIERRMNINSCKDMGAYLDLLEQSPREVNALHKEILIGVTRFFRDAEAFDVLSNKVVPDILDRGKEQGVIRAWVPACSTGEEAYGMAILLHDEARRRAEHYDIKVFATDIARGAIDYASAGSYPEGVATDVPAEYLNKYFTHKGDQYVVTRHLRESVVFAQQNILKDPPFTRIDLVSCRNLLIYLNPDAQQRLLSLFGFALKPQGYLLLGASESIGDNTEQFRTIDSRWKIFQNRSQGTSGYTTPFPTVPERRPPKTLDEYRQTNRRPDRRELENMVTALHSLLEDYVACAVLVDEDRNVIHVFGHVGRFVELPPGTVDMDVTRMLPDRLRTVAHTAIHRASRDHKEVLYRNISTEDHMGKNSAVSLRVKPILDKYSGQYLYMLIFEDTQAASESHAPIEIIDSDTTMSTRCEELEKELQYTRDDLQTTIEQLETSNEELQATNEELVSSNEELQSTNEELQSVNEELYTVNSEYQDKVQELTALSNDMDNLLRSTNLPLLFLDKELRIREYTPAIGDLMNILAQDVGRPVNHVTHRFEDDHLIEDAQAALTHMKVTERTVRAEDNRLLLLRVTPYIDPAINQPSGVVLSLVDISKFVSRLPTENA